MKTKLLGFVVYIIIVNVTYAQIYHWPLSGNLEEVVSGHDAIESVSGVSFVNDTIRGEVLNLDGINGYLEIPDDIMQGLSEITITCWFKFFGGESWQRIYNFGYSTDGIDTVSTLFLSPKDGWIGNKLHLGIGGTAGPWTDISALPVTLDDWYFCALTIKQETQNSNIVTLYIKQDETSADQVDTVFTDTVDFELSGLYPANANYIGKSSWNDPTFNGRIHDFRIFNEALSAGQITDVFIMPAAIKSIQPGEPVIYSVNGRIIIEFENIKRSKASVAVYNYIGIKMFRSSNIDDLNNQYFNPGIYIVQLRSENNIYSKKLIIR